MNQLNLLTDAANLGACVQQFFHILNEEHRAALSEIKEAPDCKILEEKGQILGDLVDYYAELFSEIIVE